MVVVVLGVGIYSIKFNNIYVVYNGILMVVFYVSGIVGIMKSIWFNLMNKEVFKIL